MAESEHAHDLQWLRKTFLFKNKPLSALLKLNKQLIRKQLYEKYFCGQEGQNWKTFTLSAGRKRALPGRPCSLQLFQEDLQRLLANMLPPPSHHEITVQDHDQEKSQEHEPSSQSKDQSKDQEDTQNSNVRFSTLRRLALESKMSLASQALEGPYHADYLTFEEFTVFLCHVAVYIHDPEAREKYDRDHSSKQKPSVDRDQGHAIFLLSSHATAGSKKPAHLQIALSLQTLLVEMKKNQMLEHEEFEFCEADLDAFKGYLEKLPASSTGASFMALAERSSMALSQGQGDDPKDAGPGGQQSLYPRRRKPAEESSDYTEGYDSA